MIINNFALKIETIMEERTVLLSTTQERVVTFIQPSYLGCTPAWVLE